MKKYPLTDLVPPWSQPKNAIAPCLASLILGAVFSIGAYGTRLNAALSEVYYNSWYINGSWHYNRKDGFDPSATMADFVTLLGGGMDGNATVYSPFDIVLIFSIAIVIVHYRGFSQGTKTQYLMKRLPDRWEVIRRCWSIPVFFLVITLLVMILMTLAYLAAYLLLSPEDCVQADQWAEFWPRFLTLFFPFSLF